MTPPTGEPSVRERLRPLVTQPIAPFRRHMAAGTLHLALVAASILAFRTQWYSAMLVLWCAIAWMDHAALTRLHEAAHAMLARNRAINEILGIAIGTASLTPLAVYRYVHHQHHAYLGREPDPEFWPYNLPGSPRWVRLAYAWAELFGGWLLTPVLYSLRTAAAWRSIKPHQRQRLVLEWAILVVVWAGGEAARRIRPGDQLLEVDGEAVLSAGQGRGMLRGPAGDPAVLLIVRARGARRRYVVQRERYQVP